MATTYQTADRAIAAYDTFIFASVGRQFDSFKAYSLAENVLETCRIAARDRSMNKTTRSYYVERAAEFRTILSA